MLVHFAVGAAGWCTSVGVSEIWKRTADWRTAVRRKAVGCGADCASAVVAGADRAEVEGTRIFGGGGADSCCDARVGCGAIDWNWRRLDRCRTIFGQDRNSERRGNVLCAGRSGCVECFVAVSGWSIFIFFESGRGFVWKRIRFAGVVASGFGGAAALADGEPVD